MTTRCSVRLINLYSEKLNCFSKLTDFAWHGSLKYTITIAIPGRLAQKIQQQHLVLPNFLMTCFMSNAPG